MLKVNEVRKIEFQQQNQSSTGNLFLTSKKKYKILTNEKKNSLKYTLFYGPKDKRLAKHNWKHLKCVALSENEEDTTDRKDKKKNSK